MPLSYTPPSDIKNFQGMISSAPAMFQFFEMLKKAANADAPVLIRTEALDAMLSCGWPGSIRELRNVMEYAHVMGEGSEVTLNDLTPELRGESSPGVEDNVKTKERRRILEALDATAGSRHETAEKLGMSRATLWRKMRKYRLDGR